MNKGQIDKLKTWFDRYVAGFYGDDGYVNANLKLKEVHSRRVCHEMQYLAGELALEPDRARLAEAIALLHDVGRFEQFVKYRTYNDPRSVDHSRLALEVLRGHNVLEQLEQREMTIIEKAIEYHGLKALPDGLDGELALFCKLIRDADKLDIYRVVADNYQSFHRDPAGFVLELELPDEPGYSREVVEDILHERPTDYSRLRTLNDMKLLQLGWVFDINFNATLRRIRQRGFLEMICGFLPQTDDTNAVRRKVFSYVDARIGTNHAERKGK